MQSSLSVRLHGLEVGEVVRRDDGNIIFDLNDEYAGDPNRLTLSQSFLLDDGVKRRERGSSGAVPPFLSNLLPEGQLRTYLAKSAGVSERKEFELLELLGLDLPGAVTVHPVADSLKHGQTNQFNDEDTTSKLLCFSLAGVQLKFSAIEKQTKGLTIPAYGIGGDWIVKLPSSQFKGLPENEYSVMSMADRVGIETPETRLVPIAEIEGLPPEVADLEESNALAVRRFDRSAGHRIHIEDFAQVTGRRPMDKYDTQLNYTLLTRVIASVCSEEDVIDFSRRLMFNTIVGNGDMHLKNWSFIYPDKRTPKLSPAYDFLCTSIYIPNERSAFKLGSSRKWSRLTLNDFARVADGAGVHRQTFVDAAADTVTRFRSTWEESIDSLPVDALLKQAIEHQMTICPAIKSVLRPARARVPKKDKDPDSRIR